jgi:hypothetical protein
VIQTCAFHEVAALHAALQAAMLATELPVQIFRRRTIFAMFLTNFSAVG